MILPYEVEPTANVNKITKEKLMAECNEKECRVAPSSGTTCHSCESECKCGQKCECECPIECSLNLWHCSFMAALKGVQAEYLKEKIRAKWGAKIEKEAEAVITAMETKWQAKMAAAKACGDLKEAMKDILCESCK